jgi:hypothetical protein
MKKLKFFKYAAAAIVLVAFAGCNDILEDVEPATSVSGEVVLTSEDGVRALRSSMYSKIRESFGHTTEYFVAPSAFTDETRNRPGSTRFQALTQAVGTSGTVHFGNWGETYDIIQDANLLIGAVEDGVLAPEVLNQFRGEAYAIRAFAYHTAVRVFGYDPGTSGASSWDSGVIIRNEPVIDVADADFRPRSSVSEVYAQILSDLSQARGLLAGTTNNTFANIAFVEGLTARGNLYAGNWSEASAAAQAAISAFPGSLESTEAGIANMFFEGSGDHPEAFLKIVVNPDTETGLGDDGTFGNDGPATYTSDGFMAQLPTQFLIDKYGEGDYRLGWYQPCADLQKNPLTQPTNCDGVNANGLSSVKFSGDKGNSVDDLPMMRLSEMYLIWAEAAAKAANDPNAGVAAVQILRDARNAGPVPAEALASVDAFEDFILDERMRELGVEGHRFYDLKRLGRDIRNPDGSIKMFSDAFRILAPLGNSLLNVNPELVENPGY